ncbi:terminase small subunit [Stenotrophomonas maltophilia]|uniref:terminase small subunit n=1 Tax=Stenotrophomonas maltophilia group sp. Smal13 TaxID=3377166 RepID=UPI002554EB2E|nr:terminase small subunit [Stenotrophomonas maltophilia]EKU9957663.1 terminase small subunit [Stenotrophomonas maltophilia]EKU9984785.1 terminase small subunit [Stenotrophomonas maltophilia]
MVSDLGSPMKQGAFGDLVGISQQAVSDLVRRGILADGAAGDEWLLAYCDHLREVAAGRGGEAGKDLTAERARLAREQADRLAMQNAVTRGELAPAHLMEQVLSKVGARAGRILETIPGTLRRRLPQLKAADVEVVAQIVAKARNLAASMRLADVDADDDPDEGASTAVPVDAEDQCE